MARGDLPSSYSALIEARELMKAAIPSNPDVMDDEDRIVYANFLVQFSIAMSLYDIARK